MVLKEYKVIYNQAICFIHFSAGLIYIWSLYFKDSIMKIQYADSTDTITVDDNNNESNQLMALKFSFSITFLMGIIALYNINEGDLNTSTYLRFILSGVSLPFLIWLIFKKTGKSEFKKEEILCLRERVSFGYRKFSFKLKNGKTRDLKEIRGKTKIDSLIALCNEVGIATTYKEVI